MSSRVSEGFALVKGVLSPDSIVLVGSADFGSPEKQFTLIGLQGPKFGRFRNSQDEAGAWDAKEFLRRLLIGQRVFFKVFYQHESGRAYGSLTLQDKRDVAELLVEAGWALVKLKDGDKTPRPEQERLFDAQARARSSGLGLHGSPRLRKVLWAPEDSSKFFEANKNRPIPAVVDGVREGSCVRVEIVTDSGNSLETVMINLHMAGVSCPRMAYSEKKVDSAESSAPDVPSEPFAEEAQSFTETRLLSRDLSVTLLGLDKSGNFFGTLNFSKGNIAQKILEFGLGKFVPWSAALLRPGDSEALKVAEAQAKAGELKIWSTAARLENQKSSTNTLKSEFHAKVLQVLSGDSFVLQHPDDSAKEIRVALASIKCPRMGRRGEAGEALSLEAREFSRSRLIGHKVRVLLEYSRSIASEAEARPFVSIFLAKSNLSELLVAAGLATLIKHRPDEERSQFYEILIQSEKSAQAAQAGLHGKSAKPQRIIDLSERRKTQEGEKKSAAQDSSKSLSAKSRQFLSFFQRESNVQCVVEYCFSATRFKLLVPKENIILALSLAGVKVPPACDQGNFPQEALNWLKPRLLQHSVRCEFETLDKGENFIGSIFLGKINIAVELVKEGLAQVLKFSASKLSFSEELFEAEREARAAKKGLWDRWVEPEVKADENAPLESAVRDGSQLWPVRITEIESANEFFVQFLDDANLALVEEEIASAAETIEAAAVEADTIQAGAGQWFAGKFADGSAGWYRIRLDGHVEDGEVRVFYLDYGNFDFLTIGEIRALPEKLKKIPPIAQRCSLAAVKAPSSEDYREGSAMAFSDLVWGFDLQAKVEHRDFSSGIYQLTISKAGEPMTVNAQMLRAGWLKLLDPKRQRKLASSVLSRVSEWRADEQFALHHHYNIWEYGDVSSDEESAENERRR